MRRPIDVPAALLRIRRKYDAPTTADDAETVARGPLILMAYGMRAVPRAAQAGYCIRTPLGDLSAEEAEAALLDWTRPHGD